MSKSKLIPAVGYARRSTDKQERSIADQKRDIERWAKENGYAIIRWYIDDALSGTSTRGRDAFADMIEAAENGRDFDALLCYDISRFSRGGTNETGFYLHRLKMADVQTFFTADGIPAGDEGELIQGVKSWQARQYSVKLSRDVIRGHVSGVLANRSLQGARAPYGYDLQYVSAAGQILRTVRRMVDGTKQELDSTGKCIRTLPAGERVGKAKSDIVRLVPGDPNRVATVKRIFSMYLSGLGYRSISLKLNDEGITAANGGRWLVGVIKDLLRNPVYTGAIAWNRSTTGKIHQASPDGIAVARTSTKRVRRKPQDQWVVIENVHEPLVSKADFDRVQDEINRRGDMGGRAKPAGRYLLSGLIKCNHCGYNFTGKKLRLNKSTSNRYRYYIDGGHNRYGAQVCPHSQIAADRLDEFVIKQIKRVILGDAKTRTKAIDAFVETVLAVQKSGGERDIASEIAATTKRIQATANMLTDPSLGDVTEIRDSLTKLQQRRDSLRREQASAKTATKRWSASELTAWAREQFDRLDETLSSDKVTPESMGLVQAFVSRIEIDPHEKHGTIYIHADLTDVLQKTDSTRVRNGERTRMVNAFPANERLWQRYAEIRAEGLRAGDGGAAGTDFYRQNREAMDAGADVSWKERFNHDELSAIQHAMNLKLQDEAAFFAEYQNEPLPEETVGADQLTADQVASKINNLPRRRVPIAGNHLTAFIDVQGKLLFYVVAAWEDDFTGYVVDYGTYPDQKRTYFTLRDARHTLATAAEGTGLEGSIYAGLESLINELLGREWQRDDGAAMKIGRCLIDANWGHSTNVVYQFCRQSSHASILLPSHGRFVGASSNPFSEYRRRPGDRVGLNWRVPTIHGKRAIRHVIYDTNWWKSFTHARLAVAMGDRGCLSIFGDRPDQHRMFAEQVTAEYHVRTEGRGRTVDEWKARPEQPDNHWLDCLVGSAVAASMQGSLLFGTDFSAGPKHGRVSFRELQRKKRS